MLKADTMYTLAPAFKQGFYKVERCTEALDDAAYALITVSKVTDSIELDRRTLP